MKSKAVPVLMVLGLCGMLADAVYIPPGPRYRCPKELMLLHPCTCDRESDNGVAISCNNTNLAVMSVALNNLASFELPIVELLIYKCHMRRLYGSLLYKVKVEKLKVVDTPIEIIEEHTFLGINETLKELHLINSSLNQFPTNAFKILGELTILNIAGHNMPQLPKDAFAESNMNGKLLVLRITNGTLSTPPPESLQLLRKLKTLDLHGNKIGALQKNQFRGLRDVEVVDLSFNEIQKVDSSHLADLTKMSWFNVSNNQLTELTRGAFARNAVLKVLNVAHNKIKRLDSNSFRGMRFLRRLFLSDNAISDVGRGTFSSLTRIGTIDLARNLLKKIDYQMFHQLNFVEKIDVSSNQVTEIQKLAFKDVFLADINLSNNNISKIEDAAFENCANISKLDLSNNRLANMGKKAFDEATYATELQFSYNFFTELNQIPLQNMSGLKILNVSHNEIIKVSKGTFPKLYELHTIDLSHNNLTEIFNSVFQTLFSLRNLNLSNNLMESIKPSTFGTLPTLLELDISNNNLRDIAKGSLSRLASTRKLLLKNNFLSKLFSLPISVSFLDLSHNEFEEIPEKSWPSMNSLLHLDLSYNRLEEERLTRGSFSNLLTLQKLNLNYNGIRRPPWEALNELTSLQYVYLEGNNISALGRAAFGKLPVVFELNLARNNLTDIAWRAFDGLLQLLVLNLTNNNLAHIPNGAFEGLVALQTLDLSFNRLEKLDNKTHGLLDDCLSLERLNLSHNKISFLTRKTFPNDPYVPYKLKEIDLSYNSMPVITFDLVYGTGKLEKLNLSQNSITDLRRGVVGNLTKLKSLDLSYNKLHDIASEGLFNPPSNMSEIYLAHNLIRNIPWKYFKNLTGLTLLDIRSNRFEDYPKDLYELTVKNVDILFEGNPLRCDCFLRPLKRHFDSRLTPPRSYRAILCSDPPYLSGRRLSDLTDDRLNCPTNVNTSRIMEEQREAYGVTPDLRFREVTWKKNKIDVRWRVVKNADIADAYVVIRDVKRPRSAATYEATLPYYRRSLEIAVEGELRRGLKQGLEYQMCLLAQTSTTAVRGFFQEQCKDLGKIGAAAAASSALKTFDPSVIFRFVCFAFVVRVL